MTVTVPFLNYIENESSLAMPFTIPHFRQGIFLSNTVHAFNKVRTCMAVPSLSRLTFHLIDKVSVKFVVIT